jgi:hypothetical protein
MSLSSLLSDSILKKTDSDKKSPLPKRRSGLYTVFTLQPRYLIQLSGLKPEALRPTLSEGLPFDETVCLVNRHILSKL